MAAIGRVEDPLGGRVRKFASCAGRFVHCIEVDEHCGSSAWRPGLMLICSDPGFGAQARDDLDRLVESEFGIPVDSKRLITLAYLAEVAARLLEVEPAEQVYALLLPFRDQVVTVPVFTLCCGSAARYLGMLAQYAGSF